MNDYAIGWAILCLVIVAGAAYRTKNLIGTLVLALCGILSATLFYLILTGGV
jgi:hypothetical protein